MNPKTQKRMLDGPEGPLEMAIDEPAAGAVGTAIIAHPHPLFGGTMDNKVVQTIARAFVQCGWRAVRFNFRGVGASAGAYANGEGERDDLISVIQAYGTGVPLALAGFSFGAAVASHGLAAMAQGNHDVQAAVLVGTAASRFQVADIPPSWLARTLIVHGEQDDTVPIASVFDWARPQGLPVTVIPGGEHFFHGRLPQLKQLIVQHLSGLAVANSRS